MALQKSVPLARIGAFIAVTLLACGIILGNQRPAHADLTVPSANAIVCYVFGELNNMGTPLPFLSAEDCPSEPPTQSGTIKVMKIVAGGSAVASDFSIHLKKDGVDVGGSPEPGSVTGTSYIGLAPGIYTVSESGGPSGYTTGFVGACDSSGTIELSAGQTVACAITNTYTETPPPPSVTGNLSVTTLVVGGAAVPADFTVSVKKSNINVSGSPQPGSASSTLYSGLLVGSYDVSVAGPVDYVTAFSGACDSAGAVAVTAAATAACTITTTYTPPATTSANLSLTKTVSDTAPNPGEMVTFTLTASNAGPAAAAAVAVTDILPAGMTYVSDDGAGAYATTTGVWTIGALASGSSTVLHIVVSINVGTEGQTLTNSASITSGNPDPDTVNNAASQAIVSTAAGGGDEGGGDEGGGDQGGSTPAPTSGGGGGGGNGPIMGSFGAPLMPGTVLGAATATPVTSCDTYLTAFIRSGAKNDVEQVKRLQTVLRDYEGAKIEVNGVYDAATLSAVHAFQAKYASQILAPWGQTRSTGFVYLTTRKKVNEIFCKNAKVFPLSAVEQAEVDQYRARTAPAQPTRPARAASAGAGTTAAAAAAAATADEQPATTSAAESAAQNAGVLNAVSRLLRSIFTR